MPPFGILPALAVSLTVAVWLVDGAAAGGRFGAASTLISAGVAGWWWGFGYFVAGLWWLGSAFLVEADQFAWALPFGVLGLPAVLAVFSALGFALSRALWSPGAGRLFAFAFGLTVAEWLRGTAFTGFPWNTLGMALGQNLWLMQAASAIGLYGLTILAILICAAPATLGTGDAGSRRWAAPGLAASALALLAAFGAWRRAARRDADGRRGEAADHAAEPAAGRQVQAGEPRRRSCGAICRSATAPPRRRRTGSPTSRT